MRVCATAVLINDHRLGATRYGNEIGVSRFRCNGGHKQTLLFQIRCHVIEAAFDSWQRNRLHQPERMFFLGGCRDGKTGQQGDEAHRKKLGHGFPFLGESPSKASGSLSRCKDCSPLTESRIGLILQVRWWRREVPPSAGLGEVPLRKASLFRGRGRTYERRGR